MDVGSGTVTGEVARLVKKIEQKIDDFIEACMASWKYIPGAIAHYAGEMAESLLSGLIEFAKDAAKILVASTAAGALIGALLGGGVGAIPGAEVGFEIGLLILEYYGLYQLVKAVLEVAGNLVAKLGEFIKLVWTANGDRKQIDQAGRTLADALGILVAAALVAAVAYLLKKGGKALSESKFAKTVGETRLAQWLKERQKLATVKELADKEAAGGGLLNAAMKAGFTAGEAEIIAEAKGIIDSPEMAQITQAHAAGKPVTVQVAGRVIQYEPGLPASGMTMFGENGFLIGREAFTSAGELTRTVLHELHRLGTSAAPEMGVSGATASAETKAAFDFANRAYEFLESTGAQ